jgi:hypothetical protein
LAYNYDVDRASNFVYDADVDDFDYEDSIETEETTDNSKSLNFLSKIAETESL